MGVAEDRWRKATIKDGRVTLFGRDIAKEPDSSTIRVLTAHNPKTKKPGDRFEYLMDRHQSGHPLTVGEYRNKVGVAQANNDLAWNLNKDYVAVDKLDAPTSDEAKATNTTRPSNAEAQTRGSRNPSSGVLRRRGMQGVYFITDDHGRVKIGSSYNIEARFKAIQSEYSDHSARLRLVRVIEREDFWRIETWLHEKYRADCHLGAWRPGTREWFTFREDMLSVQPPPIAEFDAIQKAYGSGNFLKAVRKHFAAPTP